ncbi:MAG: O-antigen ligase family protein [Deltaproteobacteria bacterium]|nr:O-antigen ligase family protein [Deltaproteobacteria bacterium]MDL1960527.1 O-antigen ligase family protein [Deltaproteobacteria bacterium]
MIFDTIKKAEPQERLAFFFIGILLSVVALDIGSVFRQIPSVILIIICNYRFIKNKNYLNAYSCLPKESWLLWISLILLVTFSAISVSYSFTSYSIKNFIDSLIYILLFTFLSVFISKYLTIWQTILVIKRVNLLFLIVYFFLILQWILMPHRPVFCKLPTLDGISYQDIFFLFSYTNNFFVSILDTSIYVLFFICLFFITLITTKPTKTDIVMFAANMAVLISTTKRGGMLAVFSGFILAPLLTKCTYRYFTAICLCICIALSCLFFTGAGKHFVRENWGLIMNGNIKQAWDERGSIPSRIYTYMAYSKQVLKQPFKGVGFGCKNIKYALPDVEKQAGLCHGHNTLLNYALEIGIQGAIFLLAVILSQARILWLALKKTEFNKQYHIFLVTSMLFMVMFWISNTFDDAFRHQTACYYWLITALITGFSMRVLSDNGYKTNGQDSLFM